MSKYASHDDIKKLTDLLNALTTRVDKQTTEIKTIFDIIGQLQKNSGKHQPTKSGGDELGPFTSRLEKVENNTTALRKLVEELRSYMNK